MKITRDKMFFSKDLIHTLAYVGMFVAAIKMCIRDSPCSALGDNVGVPIAVLFTLIVLLSVANGFV